MNCILKLYFESMCRYIERTTFLMSIVQRKKAINKRVI